MAQNTVSDRALLKGELPKVADWVDNYVLTASTVRAIVVPTFATVANFSFLGNFWLTRNAAIAGPPGVDVTDGTGATLTPTTRIVRGGETLYIVPIDDGMLAIEFWR